ncbi:hypothetical protein E2C01_032334 [Portunus trituberculatus]|uniref:Uncharacterized protein n=1 Tax=Portunus trituberculatus TaxID=210409 RepID=A0A5B7F0N4_PORTR|nr:hypothetical protein [Portunus trituberculatus]
MHNLTENDEKDVVQESKLSLLNVVSYTSTVVHLFSEYQGASPSFLHVNQYHTSHLHLIVSAGHLFQ